MYLFSLGAMSPTDTHDTTSVTLALRTLGSFDFEGKWSLFGKYQHFSFVFVYTSLH